MRSAGAHWRGAAVLGATRNPPPSSCEESRWGPLSEPLLLPSYNAVTIRLHSPHEVAHATRSAPAARSEPPGETPTPWQDLRQAIDLPGCILFLKIRRCGDLCPGRLPLPRCSPSPLDSGSLTGLSQSLWHGSPHGNVSRPTHVCNPLLVSVLVHLSRSQGLATSAAGVQPVPA